MTPEELEYFESMLNAQRKELMAASEAARHATKPVALDQASVGRLSRMDAMQAQAMAIEAQRRREVQLQRIQAALQRIKRDDYGYCAVCEEDIAIPRLKADPAAGLCITCASRMEKR